MYSSLVCRYVSAFFSVFEVRVRRVGPRTVVLSRGDPPDVRPLSPGADLLVRHRQAREHLATLEKGLFEFLTPEHVAGLLRRYRVNCVLDVGANVGQYGRALRRAGYRGRLVSFEPLPEFAKRLRATAAADPDWQVHQVALGKEDTETEMQVVSGTLSSLRRPSAFGRWRHDRKIVSDPYPVRVRRLDGLLDRVLQRIDEPRPYLKLDTQGFDLEAFAGLGDRVDEFVGMQSEVALVRDYQDMPRMMQALEAYEAAGFEVTGMFPVSRDHSTGRVVEFDCVLVRPDAVPATG